MQYSNPDAIYRLVFPHQFSSYCMSFIINVNLQRRIKMEGACTLLGGISEGVCMSQGGIMEAG